MRQHITMVYTWDELSDAAKRRAWETGPDFSGDFSGDFRETLAAFEKYFDISVYDYRVGDSIYNPHFSYVTAGRADECPEGDALRVARFIWNNYADYISKGKYYSTPGRYDENGKYTYKSRYSKITKQMDNCPLTGVCFDCDILQPVIDCLHYKRFFNSYNELMDACLSNFFRIWDAEIEYCQSFEYFAEIMECNDYEFTENGDFFRGHVA